MLTPKHTSKQSAPESSMQEIYNLLMSQIEPDLTTEMISQLDELYAGETSAERKKRLARYERAFVIYEERFARLMQMWKGDIQRERDAVISKTQSKKKSGK